MGDRRADGARERREEGSFWSLRMRKQQQSCLGFVQREGEKRGKEMRRETRPAKRDRGKVARASSG